jgi:hypothetical protein
MGSLNRDDAKAFLTAGLIAAFLMVGMFAFAHAEDAQPKPPMRFTCWTVRKAVKLYGEAELVSMARATGISEKEIEMAKRCLKP